MKTALLGGKSGPQADIQLEERRAVLFDLFVAFAPLLVFLPDALFSILAGFGVLSRVVRPLDQLGGALSLPVYLAGCVLELVLLGVLRRAQKNGKIGARRKSFGDYLVRTLVGLPLTIYFAVVAPYGFAALLRFGPVLFQLLGSRHRNEAIWFAVFFLLGTIGFAFPLNTRVGFLPGSAIATALIGGVGAVVLVLWVRRLRSAALLGARRDLEFARLARREARVRTMRDSLVGGILPDLQASLVKRGSPLRPEAGNYILAGLYFGGLHASLADFQKDPSRSDQEALQDFQSEWDRYIRHTRAELEACGLRCGPASSLMIVGRQFQEQDFGAPAAALFEVYFALLRLTGFTERCRRSLEGRGRSGWYLTAALLTASAVEMGAGGPELTWSFRGVGPHKLETLGHSLLERSQPEHTDAILLQRELLDDLLADGFAERPVSKSMAFGDFVQPGLLKADYSIDGKGLEPLPDFLQRFGYQAGGGQALSD